MKRLLPSFRGRVLLGAVAYCLTFYLVVGGATCSIVKKAEAADRAPAVLVEINREVNRSIRFEAEPPGQNVVRFGPKRGDCEDYAETKRLHLIGAGWPRRELRVHKVTWRNQCHAVLIARDPQGRRWVLDNRTADVETIEQTGRRYTWNGCAERGRA